MSKLLLYTHLGLGDHFIFNGLIRYVINHTPQYENYEMVVKERNLETVRRMYSDLDNLTYFVVGSEESTPEILNKIGYDQDLLRVGFVENGDEKFDMVFYRQVGIPFEAKYEYFKTCRDNDMEQKCFDENYPNEKYIFVHDSCSDMNFDLKIRDDLKIVRPSGSEYCLMDYLKLIENAEEVHCIDSSFLNMIELCCERENLFFHDIRVLYGGIAPYFGDKWEVIPYGKGY